MADPLLVADIGGTNARFALLDEGGDGGVGPVHHYKLDDFAGIAEATAAFLEARASGRRPRGAVLAVAGPVSGNRARLTNRGGQWYVEDLGSTNGTYLDQQRVQGPLLINPGQPIRIGQTALELRS